MFYKKNLIYKLSIFLSLGLGTVFTINGFLLLNGKTYSLLEVVLIQGSLFSVTLIASLFFKNRLILNRLKKLKSQASDLHDMHVSETFGWNEGDEIDSVGKSLEGARLVIKGIFSQLVTANTNLRLQNDSLEKTVDEKSKTLIESTRLTSLGEMAAGIAHEINNPLAIIVGKASRVKRFISKSDLKDREELAKDLAVIEVTVQRVAKIVKGLRTFSRNGELDPFEEFSVREILDEVLEVSRARLVSNGYEIGITNIHSDLKIRCRPVQLGQVFLNLLNNAFDATFTEEGSKWIRIELIEDVDFIEFKFFDCGKGISKEVANKLFQPFFTTKGVGKGTGLGLSVSHGIVASHGGALSVDSGESNTCFVVRLPRDPDRFIQLKKAA